MIFTETFRTETAFFKQFPGGGVVFQYTAEDAVQLKFMEAVGDKNSYRILPISSVAGRFYKLNVNLSSLFLGSVTGKGDNPQAVLRLRLICYDPSDIAAQIRRGVKPGHLVIVGFRAWVTACYFYGLGILDQAYEHLSVLLFDTSENNFFACKIRALGPFHRSHPFPLYSERKSPATARRVPAAEIQVTGSLRISADVATVMTGTM